MCSKQNKSNIMSRNIPGESQTTSKEYYDINGHRVHEVYVDGELAERTQYDSKDQMVEVLIPGEERTTYTYDRNGDEIETHQYFIGEDGVEEHVYQGFKKYDEEGRLIEYVYANLYDGHFRYTYKYQEFEGKILKKEYDESGELVDVELVIC